MGRLPYQTRAAGSIDSYILHARKLHQNTLAETCANIDSYSPQIQDSSEQIRFKLIRRKSKPPIIERRVGLSDLVIKAQALYEWNSENPKKVIERFIYFGIETNAKQIWMDLTKTGRHEDNVAGFIHADGQKIYYPIIQDPRLSKVHLKSKRGKKLITIGRKSPPIKRVFEAFVNLTGAFPSNEIYSLRINQAYFEIHTSQTGFTLKRDDKYHKTNYTRTEEHEEELEKQEQEDRKAAEALREEAQHIQPKPRIRRPNRGMQNRLRKNNLNRYN